MTAQAPSARARKPLVLVACILGSGVVFLDTTVVNVALPAIQRDLDATLAGQQWVVEAYLLTLSSLLLVGGSLGDMLDRRTVFAAGLAGFGACSLLCALAPNVELLIAARALQGVAGAMLVPSTLAIIVSTFAEDERGRAIGTWTAWTGIATVVGPLAGGGLIDAASWRFVFLLNVPLVLGTLALTAHAIPRARADRAEARVDWIGAALCATGLGGAIFALIEEPRLHLGPAVVASGAAGVAALVAFVFHERRTAQPMLPLGLFRSRNFAVGNTATLTLYAGLGAALFLISLFLQQVAGYSALGAGASFLPITALMFTLSRRTGALADRVGPRVFMSAGPLVAAAGLALLVLRVHVHARYASEVLPGLIVFGVGLAVTVAPLTATVLAAVDPEHSGVASGVNNAVARVAGLIAVAAIGAIVAANFAHTIDRRLPDLPPASRSALTSADSQPLSTSAARRLPPPQRRAGERLLASASLDAFQLGIGLSSALVLLGGLVAAVGIENARRRVRAAQCPGGAVYGASRELARADGAGRLPAAVEAR